MRLRSVRVFAFRLPLIYEWATIFFCRTVAITGLRPENLNSENNGARNSRSSPGSSSMRTATVCGATPSAHRTRSELPCETSSGHQQASVRLASYLYSYSATRYSYSIVRRWTSGRIDRHPSNRPQDRQPQKAPKATKSDGRTHMAANQSNDDVKRGSRRTEVRCNPVGCRNQNAWQQNRLGARAPFH